jgi:hypothetical protein
MLFPTVYYSINGTVRKVLPVFFKEIDNLLAAPGKYTPKWWII